MPARYHPLFDGLWNDEKFDGAPFEEIGFFIFLFANARMRPSGIYRVTDQQMSTDSRLALAKVRRYTEDLDRRGAIVRDQAWMFVCGYLQRQPKHENLLNGVHADLSNCSSERILRAFSAKYPQQRKWSNERLATLAQRMLSVDRIGGSHRAEQSSTNLKSTEQSSEPKSGSRHHPEQIRDVLERMDVKVERDRP